MFYTALPAVSILMTPLPKVTDVSQLFAHITGLPCLWRRPAFPLLSLCGCHLQSDVCLVTCCSLSALLAPRWMHLGRGFGLILRAGTWRLQMGLMIE